MMRNNNAITILLADDDPDDRMLAQDAFDESRLTNKFEMVEDGEELMDYLHHRGKFTGHANGLPVVVLLDLKMPKVDGLEVLHQMRADPELKLVPVVMITSSREEQDLIRSYQLGVNAYVVKPVDFQKFVESIKQVGFF